MPRSVKPIPFPNWVDAHRSVYLTRGEVNDMPVGARIKVICMDRNFPDVVLGSKHVKPGTIMKPKDAFKRSVATFTKGSPEKGLRGKIKFFGLLTEAFEMHIEYRKGFWYALNDGVLPKTMRGAVDKTRYQGRRATSFPRSTPVGWRGPMIPLSRLPSTPVYFPTDDEDKAVQVLGADFPIPDRSRTGPLRLRDALGHIIRKSAADRAQNSSAKRPRSEAVTPTSMRCKNDPTRRYKGSEPSPKGNGFCAHACKLGTVKKGRNNKMWKVTATKAGVLRWTRM